MIEKINQLLSEIETLQISNLDELEALRLKYLSKKGAINALMADFRNVAAEEKKTIGIKINELKNKAQEKFNDLLCKKYQGVYRCDLSYCSRAAFGISFHTAER